MKFIALILGLQFFVLQGFSQEQKKDIQERKLSKPQPVRMTGSIHNHAKKDISSKQKTAENKRITELDAFKNRKNKEARKSKNLRIEKK